MNIQLTNRDKSILLLLKQQGFVSFDQLAKRFFTAKSKASDRLKQLESKLYIQSYNAKSYLVKDGFASKVFPYLQSTGIHPKTKIFTLHSVFKRQFPETNRLIKKDLCLHQLLLNDVYFFLEDKVFPQLHIDKNKIMTLNDPEHKLLSEADLTKRKEFAPDLTVIQGEMTLSIELERTAKNQNRYQDRFWYYEDSSYTHILYYYVNEAHLKNLLSYSGLSHKFAFAHYIEPNKVYSRLYGYMTVVNWINHINKMQNINLKK